MNTTYFLNLVATNIYNIQPRTTIPNKLYIGLSTTSPNSDGSGVTEPIVANNGYARVALDSLVAKCTAYQVVVTNNEDIEFPVSAYQWGSDGWMNYYVVFDSQTGGNLLMYGALVPRKFVGEHDMVVIQKGNLELSVGNEAVSV